MWLFRGAADLCGRALMGRMQAAKQAGDRRQVIHLSWEFSRPFPSLACSYPALSTSTPHPQPRGQHRKQADKVRNLYNWVDLSQKFTIMPFSFGRVTSMLGTFFLGWQRALTLDCRE